MADLDYEGATAEDDRINAIVLGRKIGTASGWDQMDTAEIMFYDLVPDPLVGLPAGDICAMYSTGCFEAYDPENGNVIWSEDMLWVVAALTPTPLKAAT